MKADTLGNRLTKVLDEKGISSKKLAELSGLTPSSISYFKKDKRKPSDETIKTIAKVLNVDFDWLENGNKLINVSARKLIDNNADSIMTDDELFEMEASLDKYMLEELTTSSINLSIPEKVLLDEHFETFLQIDASEWFLLNVFTQLNKEGKNRIVNYIRSMSVKIEDITKGLKKIMLYYEIIAKIQNENWYLRQIPIDSISNKIESEIENHEIAKLNECIMRRIMNLQSNLIEVLNERLHSYVSMDIEDWNLLVMFNLLESKEPFFDTKLMSHISREKGLVMDLLEELVVAEKYRD